MCTIGHFQAVEKYYGKCLAYGKFGHPAKKCNMFATYLWIMDFMKGKMEKEQDAALEHWAKKNKP